MKVMMYVHWCGIGGAEDLCIDQIKYSDRSKTEYQFITEEASGWSQCLQEIQDMGVPIHRVAKRHEFLQVYESFKPDIVHVLSCGDVQDGYGVAIEMGIPVVDVLACVAYPAGWERYSSTGLINPVYLCQKHWEHGGGGRKEFRIVVAGVDIDRCISSNTKGQDKAKWGLDPNKPVVGFFGRADQFKCPFTFVDVTRFIHERNSECQFIMFGGGVDLGRTQWLADQAGVNIKFPGFVRDKASAFNCMDVFLFLSWQEAFGRVAPEAMVSGIPIVTNDYPVLRELCQDAAIYVEGAREDPMPFKYSKAYADTVITLLGDEDKMKSMGEIGKHRSREFYDARRMSKDYENLYEEILALR